MNSKRHTEQIKGEAVNTKKIATSDKSAPSSRRVIGRRSVLASIGVAVASSTSPNLLGQEIVFVAPGGSAPHSLAREIVFDLPKGPVQPFVDRGYRLYIVNAKTRSADLTSFNVTYLDPPLAAPGNVKGLLWATQTVADEVAKLVEVTSVHRRTPADVYEHPTAKKNSKSFYFDCRVPIETGASPHQVTASLRKKLAGEQSVQIGVIKAYRQRSISHRIRSGQISVRCRDHEQAKRVMEVIKQHAQVIEIQWNTPFLDVVEYACPGCGIG